MSETSFRELLVQIIELYKERRKVDKELEEKKEAIRQHSGGKKRQFSILGFGKVSVAAKRTKGFEVDLESLNNLNREQLDWLINKNVLRLSLNKSVFKSLNKKAKKRILATGCIKQVEYEDGQLSQRVSIRVEENEETRNTRNIHDSNLPNSRDVTDIKEEEEIDAGYDDDEEYDDDEDLIARNPDLDDYLDEAGRSQEEGWPYADYDGPWRGRW